MFLHFKTKGNWACNKETNFLINAKGKIQETGQKYSALQLFSVAVTSGECTTPSHALSDVGELLKVFSWKRL